MKFLVDHYAGRRLAEWLRAKGHDVFVTVLGARIRVAGPRRWPPGVQRRTRQ